MNQFNLPIKKTKIVCTIGPASESRQVLEKMISSGMNVARLNFAHGDFESHAQVIANIRAAAAAVGERVAIMGDLPGPKMRIGSLAQDPVYLERGQSFIMQTDEIVGDGQCISMNFERLPQVVKAGDKIFVNDGFIQLEVERVEDTKVYTRVIVGGELRSYKGVNLPGIDLGICAFTERDEECLQFASQQGLDAISQSFVQEAGDIEAVRTAAADLGYDPFIVAKIERSRAVDELEAILECTDGIMVARGDLGVEIPIEEIAVVQKKIIRRANLHGKPVITATHMLESMVDHNRPTRAEATDVANAILDGTDCLMLSGETAMGNFPVDSVAVMTRIACVAEKNLINRDVVKLLQAAKERGDIETEDLISLSIDLTVEVLNPVAVITPTLSGATARRISRFRVPVWIMAVSPNEDTCQNLCFSYGVYPVHEMERPVSWERYTRQCLGGCGIGDGLVILTRGYSTPDSGGTNHIEIVDLSGPSGEESIW
ncbi:MAG: pyruvate kinase [Anaerolineales bacterium]|jgi:pyruvate kinase